ncbi:MAG: hypothetical protein E3J83_04355 [Candidatus Atribacteria bacterium]|nr:MAG: hypothetical protein E3J83_04355 [Candidatus Atribacteria bacterium]
MKIRFLQPSYEDEFNQKFIKIKEDNEPEYIGGLFVPINGKIGKIYYLKNGKDIEEEVIENTIYIAKQSKYINTIRILLHELTHYIILKIIGDWQFLQKLLDKNQEAYKR